MNCGRPDAFLSLEQKLYQLIIPRLEGDRIRDPRYRDEVRDLVDRGVGGFILFGGSLNDLPTFLASLQSQSRVPLFIASDIERGVGQQVCGTTSFPCPMAFAAAADLGDPGDMELVTSCLKAVAAEAGQVGINMPLLPVLDVNRNPQNPIICTRAFSDRPDEVARFGELFIRVLEGEGLLCCAKHFPGHGDTATDSHLSLPLIRKPLEALRNEDLPPFARAISAGVSCVMVGHLAVPSLDSRPASLSRETIEGLLRRDLSFTGLVLTDALNMGALGAVDDVAAASLEAGADILLHPLDPHASVTEILGALNSGRISGERIERSLEKILVKKTRLRVVQRGHDIDYHRHAALASAVAERSVTIVKADPGSLPLSSSDRVAIAVVGDTPPGRPLLFADFSDTVFDPGSSLEAPESLAGRTVVIAIFTSVAAWKGTSGISPADIQRVSDLVTSAGRTIIVSFGSPYVLNSFRNADVLIAAYEATEPARAAVLRALRGELPFRGRLPVTLHGL